jgi:VIT1/CCC1 family predicted Fe2+/Mn2+ transporter
MKKLGYSLYFPQIIYGGIDGLVTTFAIVAGATGGWLSAKTIIIMGIANVLADGVSMSIGAYLSSREDTNKKIWAYRVAVTTFSAFIVFGFLPLLPYIFSFGNFLLSGIITGWAFLCIGYLKGVMNHSSLSLAIIQTALLGSVAASIAYYAGLFLGSL